MEIDIDLDDKLDADLIAFLEGLTESERNDWLRKALSVGLGLK